MRKHIHLLGRRHVHRNHILKAQHKPGHSSLHHLLHGKGFQIHSHQHSHKQIHPHSHAHSAEHKRPLKFKSLF